MGRTGRSFRCVRKRHITGADRVRQSPWVWPQRGGGSGNRWNRRTQLVDFLRSQGRPWHGNRSRINGCPELTATDRLRVDTSARCTFHTMERFSGMVDDRRYIVTCLGRSVEPSVGNNDFFVCFHRYNSVQANDIELTERSKCADRCQTFADPLGVRPRYR